MDFIIAAESTLTPMEKLSLGGSTLLLGLLMVFIVLGLLIGVVSLVKVIMLKAESRKNKKAAAKVETAPAPALPVSAPVVNNNDEIVAAISAAISMYYETESVSIGKSVSFRVRSIREIR